MSFFWFQSNSRRRDLPAFYELHTRETGVGFLPLPEFVFKKSAKFWEMLFISTTITRWRHLFQTVFQFSQAMMGLQGRALYQWKTRCMAHLLCVITGGHTVARNGFTGDAHCPIFLRLTRGQSNFSAQWAGTLHQGHLNLCILKITHEKRFKMFPLILLFKIKQNTKQKSSYFKFVWYLSFSLKSSDQI